MNVKPDKAAAGVVARVRDIEIPITPLGMFCVVAAVVAIVVLFGDQVQTAERKAERDYQQFMARSRALYGDGGRKYQHKLRAFGGEGLEDRDYEFHDVPTAAIDGH